MKPLFPASRLDFSSPSLTVEGKDPQMLRRQLEEVEYMLNGNITASYDRIRINQGKISIDKQIPHATDRSWGGINLLRREDSSLLAGAASVNAIARALLEAGF
jgi:hypothetical protein